MMNEDDIHSFGAILLWANVFSKIRYLIFENMFAGEEGSVWG
jgi:hypothetical protein